jgi:hypothetical protein
MQTLMDLMRRLQAEAFTHLERLLVRKTPPVKALQLGTSINGQALAAFDGTTLASAGGDDIFDLVDNINTNVDNVLASAFQHCRCQVRRRWCCH